MKNSTTGGNSKPSKPNHGGNRNKNAKRGNGKGKNQSFKPIPDQLGDRNQRRAAEISDTAGRMSRSNPVEFYDKYKEFARDAANIPFATPLGAIFKHWEVSDQANAFTVPGVMRIRFLMTPGISEDYSSPINKSSIQLWTYLRSVQKAAAKYDHQDITMYLFALDSAVAFYELMKRTYGLLRDVTPLNRYYPTTLISASGFIASNLQANLADFRMYINSYAISLRKFFIPKDIALLDRHRWMCEGLYTDSESVRAQTYMFVPQAFWRYDNTVSTGSQLVQEQWLSDAEEGVLQHTFAEVVTFGNKLLNAISNDEDFAFISGDLYNLYGSGMELPFVEPLYTILPSYDKRVLSQIENATVRGKVYTDAKITQDPSVNNGAILFKPKVSWPTQSIITTTQYMNMHMDEVTPDDVLEASRLMSVMEIAPDTYGYVTECGTELVCGVDIYRINPSTGNSHSTHSYVSDIVIKSDQTAAEIINALHDFMLINVFDWCPRIVIVYHNVNSGERWILGTTWDIDNFAPVPNDQLHNMHEAALWSEFKVPEGNAGKR